MANPIIYNTDNNLIKLIFFNIFKIANNRKNPTDTPIATINTVLGNTDSVCNAKTDKSGSATVITNPNKNTTKIKIQILPCFVKPLPTLLPIGVIACSAP